MSNPDSILATAIIAPETARSTPAFARPESKPLTIAEAAERAANPHSPPTNYVDVVFDGFPNPDGPRFIELENEVGHSIAYGQWIKRDDGHCVLRIPLVKDK